jgi:acyl-CoA thioester hydrolase
MIFDYQFRVRYAETDAMRVAHHAAYLVWFEAGRVEFLRSLGFDFGDLEAAGYGQAVREVRLLYRRPVRFDQRLRLRIALVAAAGPRLVFGYRLFDATEWEASPKTALPVAMGLTELVWVTPAGRPTRLPAAHSLAAVLARAERHPDWATW